MGRIDRLARFGCLVATALVASVAAQLFPFGSLRGNWLYPYYRQINLEGVLVFAITLVCALPLVAWTTSLVQRREVLAVAVWLAAAGPLQLLLRAPYPASLETIVRSVGANSYWTATLDHGFLEILADFGAVAPSLPDHARGNMPGKPGLFFALGILTSDPGVMGLAIVLLSNLAGVLAYLIARELLADRRTALFALILTLFLPGKLVFLPVLNTVAPVFILLAFLLLLRLLRSRGAGSAALLGADVYATAFFDPFPLTMAPLFAAFVARAWARGELRPAEVLRLLAISGAGFLSIHAAMRLAFGFDLFAALHYVLEDARRFVGGANRPYEIWVAQNLIEFLVSLGACSAVVWLGDLGRALAGSSGGPPGRPGDRLLEPSNLLSASGLGILLLIDLSGTIRGEVTRLWIFLACFLQIPVAAACARSPGNSTFAVVLGASLLQAAVTISMVAFVVP